MGSGGPKTKNDYAREGQQKFTGLDWTGPHCTELNGDTFFGNMSFMSMETITCFGELGDDTN
jgi:hypothetical protein